MDRACFRRNCKLVSGRAEVVSAGAEDLVLGVVCVVRGGGREGGGKCREFAAKWFTFPGKNGKMAVESTFPAGKCRGSVEIWFTFREEQTRNGRSGYG